MGPDGALPIERSEFTDKVQLAFTEWESYRACRNEVELWGNLTNVTSEKKGIRITWSSERRRQERHLKSAH